MGEQKRVIFSVKEKTRKNTSPSSIRQPPNTQPGESIPRKTNPGSKLAALKRQLTIFSSNQQHLTQVQSTPLSTLNNIHHLRGVETQQQVLQPSQHLNQTNVSFARQRGLSMTGYTNSTELTSLKQQEQQMPAGTAPSQTPNQATQIAQNQLSCPYFVPNTSLNKELNVNGQLALTNKSSINAGVVGVGSGSNPNKRKSSHCSSDEPKTSTKKKNKVSEINPVPLAKAQDVHTQSKLPYQQSSQQSQQPPLLPNHNNTYPPRPHQQFYSTQQQQQAQLHHQHQLHQYRMQQQQQQQQHQLQQQQQFYQNNSESHPNNYVNSQVKTFNQINKSVVPPNASQIKDPRQSLVVPPAYPNQNQFYYQKKTSPGEQSFAAGQLIPTKYESSYQYTDSFNNNHQPSSGSTRNNFESQPTSEGGYTSVPLRSNTSFQLDSASNRGNSYTQGPESYQSPEYAQAPSSLQMTPSTVASTSYSPLNYPQVDSFESLPPRQNTHFQQLNAQQYAHAQSEQQMIYRTSNNDDFNSQSYARDVDYISKSNVHNTGILKGINYDFEVSSNKYPSFEEDELLQVVGKSSGFSQQSGNMHRFDDDDLPFLSHVKQQGENQNFTVSPSFDEADSFFARYADYN